MNEVRCSSAGPAGRQGAGFYKGLTQRSSGTQESRCCGLPGPQRGPVGSLSGAERLGLANEAPLETFPAPSKISKSPVLLEHSRSAATWRKGTLTGSHSRRFLQHCLTKGILPSQAGSLRTRRSLSSRDAPGHPCQERAASFWILL